MNRREIKDLMEELVSDVDQGECFHWPALLDEFVNKLDRLKDLAKQELEENKRLDKLAEWDVL